MELPDYKIPRWSNLGITVMEKSKVFVLEYNPTFGHNMEITIPEIKNFGRFKSHYSGCYYGASLKAMIKLMDTKGFNFIGTNKLNFNAFFVNQDLSKSFDSLINNIKSLEDYTLIKARDSRDINGKLDFLSNKSDRLEKIKNLDVIDVSNSSNKKFKIKDIMSDI